MDSVLRKACFVGWALVGFGGLCPPPTAVEQPPSHPIIRVLFPQRSHCALGSLPTPPKMVARGNSTENEIFHWYRRVYKPAEQDGGEFDIRCGLQDPLYENSYCPQNTIGQGPAGMPAI